MIKSFNNKALEAYWTEGKTAKLPADLLKRIIRKLDVLDAAGSTTDLNVHGFDFHPLNGFDPTRYAISVNGPWRLTFEFSGGDAYAVDLEQYH